jgi:endonuclease I
MNIRRVFLVLLAGIILISAGAQPPAGYYDPAAGKTGKALQQSLHDIIDNHTVLTYSDLWTAFQKTDKKPDGTVWDIYSDIPGGTPAYTYTFSTDQCGNYSKEGDCYNREHSFPKSWFNDAMPMYTDLFHIYPTDGWVNNKRGNYPFGETAAPTWTSTNGSTVGPSSWSGYTGVVFEPIDAYKGDFARTYFYMATRYYGEDAAWPGSEMTTGAQPKAWALDMLLAWHRTDPVSAKETDRNNEVWKYQNNRNPFIDNPLYAEMIWGTLNAVPGISRTYNDLSLWPNPASDYLRIRVPGEECAGTAIILFDISGCTLRQYTLEEEETAINISSMPAGIYYIRLTCNDAVYSGSFVVAGR